MAWLLQQMPFYLMFGFAGLSAGDRLFSNAMQRKPFSVTHRTFHFLNCHDMYNNQSC